MPLTRTLQSLDFHVQALNNRERILQFLQQLLVLDNHIIDTSARTRIITQILHLTQLLSQIQIFSRVLNHKLLNLKPLRFLLLHRVLLSLQLVLQVLNSLLVVQPHLVLLRAELKVDLLKEQALGLQVASLNSQV